MTTTLSLTHLPHVVLPEDYQLRPGPFLAAMHEQHGPVFASTSAWGDEFVYLVGPEANRFALVTHGAAFSHYAGWNTTESGVAVFGRGLVFEDGDLHARHRRLLEPPFTAAQLGAYVPAIRSIVVDRIGGWEIGVFDAYEEAHRITFEIAARSLFGIDDPARIERIRTVFLDLLSLDFAVLEHTADGLEWGDQRLRDLRNQLHDLVREEIALRTPGSHHDVLGALLSGGLTDDEILAHVNVMLLAAHATTTALCAWLVQLLAAHPDYQERVAAKVPGLTEAKLASPLPVLDNAVLETERLFPPIANLPRVTTCELEFAARTLPAGTLVFVSVAGSHHLPHIFAQPEAFDPDRFALPRIEHRRNPYSLIGFSTGPRRCLGVRVARLEAKILVVEALRRYRLEPVGDADVPVLYHPIAMPLHAIPIRVVPRAPR